MKEFLEEALALWHESAGDLPPLGRRYTAEEQSAREALFDACADAIQAEFRRIPRTRPERGETHARITAAFERFARQALAMEDRHLDLLLRGGFSGVGASLARAARAFDPSVSMSDILQACRNAWTACGLQALTGRTMQVTPSIFAYSMLYPYSDNYMDDTATARATKLGFSARFGRRLAGESVQPEGAREVRIWQLVGCIESEYGRAEFPGVFESLLAIHRAQQDSLRLRAGVEEVDVLKLSFAKGGSSVLADVWLAAGSPDDSEARFAFLWGVLLQLGDDLQDLRQDCAEGSLTLFSDAVARGGKLDDITNRALRFGFQVMMRMAGLPQASATLKDLLAKSSRSLFIRAAGDAAEFYTGEYLAQLECHSPFRFAFLAERRKEMARRSGLFGKLFEAFLAGEDDEPVFPLMPGAMLPR